MTTITMKEAARAWGEGKEVEWSNQYQFKGEWQPILEGGFYFNTSVQYRLKPEVTTSLTDDQIRHIYYEHLGVPAPSQGMYKVAKLSDALRGIADAAIKQYIAEQQK